VASRAKSSRVFASEWGQRPTLSRIEGPRRCTGPPATPVGTKRHRTNTKNPRVCQFTRRQDYLKQVCPPSRTSVHEHPALRASPCSPPTGHVMPIGSESTIEVLHGAARDPAGEPQNCKTGCLSRECPRTPLPQPLSTHTHTHTHELTRADLAFKQADKQTLK
jgi:hypothetical protein